MEYPVVETFFSIQGEGYHTGQPCNFIRLAGCPINCKFCDTNKEVKEVRTQATLVKRMTKGYPVVITGGEPCIHDLGPLTTDLHYGNFQIWLETSGIAVTPYYADYVAVSPKVGHHFRKDVASRADEVKWLVPEWSLEEIQVLSEFFAKAEHYIQPVNDYLMVNKENVQKAIQIATYLKWPVSIQMHKIIGVR